MSTPDRIKQLVETFEQNINEYRSNKNETELRRQFLDPFFEALGWDVDNRQGAHEAGKEVAHEFSVEIDRQQKKADPRLPKSLQYGNLSGLVGKGTVERQIKSTDGGIDKLVYELYGLTEDEIRIVEG